MSYDIERETIYETKTEAVVLDGETVIGASVLRIETEGGGTFRVSRSVEASDLDLKSFASISLDAEAVTAIMRRVSQSAAVGDGARFKHKKRGTIYRVIGEARVQASTVSIHEGDEITVYRAESGGALWARPVAEFHDGRFERLASTPATPADGEG